MRNGNIEVLKAPLRQFKSSVIISNNDISALSILFFTSNDYLKSFKLERIGESGKFFGFGVTQKLTINALDKDRILKLEDKKIITVDIGSIKDEEYTETAFYNIKFIINHNEIQRDENTNELTIVAYDSLAEANNYIFSELELEPPYTITQVAQAIARKLKLDGLETNIAFPTKLYTNGANLEGTETLREVLDDIAEATQTIYYVDYDNNLMFKRLSNSVQFDIDKSMYFDLDSGDKVTLAAISSTTELGDNIIANSTTTGVTQYISDNAFLTLEEDIDTILEDAIEAVGGTAIQQFNCSWRGNYYLDIGDLVKIQTKDDNYIYSYILNDVIEFNGALKQKTEWEYTKSEDKPNNPTTLGEVLKQTYAKVDKANRKIELVASETSANTTSISALEVNTNSINASISKIQEDTEREIENTKDSISKLTQRVDAQLTEAQIDLKISTEIANGTTKVTTATGFTFDENGLNISKSNSEMNTQITENGMTVYKNNTAILTANNTGVDAVNLRASTYLIIGTNSRLEDYGSRTGCFWIGG